MSRENLVEFVAEKPSGRGSRKVEHLWQKALHDRLGSDLAPDAASQDGHRLEHDTTVLAYYLCLDRGHVSPMRLSLGSRNLRFPPLDLELMVRMDILGQKCLVVELWVLLEALDLEQAERSRHDTKSLQMGGCSPMDGGHIEEVSGHEKGC